MGARGLGAAALVAPVLAGLVSACGDEAATGPVPGLPPTVLAVDPEVLRPGDTAVLEGLNFHPDADANQVEVAGTPAPVIPPSRTTRLRIRVPAGGEAACEPTRPVELSVTVRGRTGTTSHPLSPAPTLTLEAGGSAAWLEQATVRCQNLPAGDAAYLVSVSNAATAAGQAVPFRLRGRPGQASSAAAEPGPGPAGSWGPGTGAGAEGGLVGGSPLDRLLRGRLVEAEILDRGRDVLRRAGPPSVRREPSGRVVGGDPPPQEGELVDFRVPDLSRTDACANYHDVTARVAHVSPTAVIVEDTAAPLAGQMDDVYQALAAEYESVMDPIVREYFGDPLIYDDQLDDDDHFYMLFTPRVNQLPGALAFVWGGDYTGRLTCASSDEAELFYGLVPTATGGGAFDLETVEGWERVMRPTTIHEVKHIAAFAAHQAGGSARQEDRWLEEATAMVAEEIYARQVFGYGPDGNVGYGEGLSCEMDPGAAGCDDAPLVMAAHFSFLREYLSALENRSPLGGGLAFLGGGWWLLRWALDHASASEAAFLRALTSETSLFGVENLEARMGRPFPEILADWTLALEADDRPGSPPPAREELTIPSWDVRSVFAGLHEARPESFPVEFPLVPRERAYGDFLLSVGGVPGGSAMLLELTASTDVQQLLEVLDPDGGPPPPELGLSILRIR